MNNLKKMLGIFTVLSFSFICLNVSLATTGIVNTPAARVREKASTDSEVVTKVYEDEEVEILDEVGDWYKVKVNGKTGYVSKSLIKTSGSATSAKNTTSTNTSNNSVSNTNTDNTAKANTNTTGNNVSTYSTEQPRNTESKNIINKDTSLKLLPNFGSNELRFLSKGTEVKIEKELNNWIKVTLVDNSTGWILKNNITYGKVEESEEQLVEPEDNVNIEESTNTNTITVNTAVTNTSANVTDNNITNTSTDNVSNNNVTTGATSEVKNAKGKVSVETANVRETPSKSAIIIERLDEGDEVTIVGEDGEWYKITSSKVSSGYVSKSLIRVTSSEVSSRSLAESREEDVQETMDDSTNGGAVVEFAKKYLGVSYVLGGKTPESGFDCSGFTRYVFKNFGYSLGTVAADQDSVGMVVERENLKPGDLILFLNEGKTRVGHTGIYIGNNEFIHAANPERGVVVDNLSTNSYYRERFVTARRIIE